MAYCPTKDMVADFFMKLLQGSLFCKFRTIILNLPSDPVSQLQEHVESSRCGNDDVICQLTDGDRSAPPDQRSTTASYAEVAHRGCSAEHWNQVDKLTCLDKQK